MSYERQTFVDDETTLTAAHLNHMEDGIAAVHNKHNAPESGQEVFTYEMDTSYDDVQDIKQSTEVQHKLVKSTDEACIMFPSTYTATGKPTKLVIMNRGAGGDYTGSMAYRLNYGLLAAGFATLHVRGIPKSFQNSKYIQGVYGAPYGSPIFIRSVVEAYNYVINKYNIDTEGCVVYGASCGGLQSLNLVNAQVLPVVGAAIDAPVVDLHNDCYFGGDWITGSLGGKTAAGVAWMYQFDHCDFDAGTYTINGTTYNFADVDTASLEQLWQLNKKRVETYNAYESGKFVVSLDGDTPVYGIKFPCPVKCWFGDGESTNQISIARDFIERCRVGGTIAEMRTCPTNSHGVHMVTTDKSGNDIAVKFNDMTLSPYAVEEIMWLSRWAGISANNVRGLTEAEIFIADTGVTLNGTDGSLVSKGSDKAYFIVSDYIEIPDNSYITQFASITHNDGTNAYCVFYDADKKFISSYKSTTTDTSLVGEHRYTTTPPTIPDGAKYIRVAFNNGLETYTNADIAKREYALLEFGDIIMSANVGAYLNGTDGSLVSRDEKYMIVSDYVEIPENSVISQFGAITATALANSAYCAFYDENKTFVSSVMSSSTKTGGITGSWVYLTTPPEIPDGAKYIRVAFNNGLETYTTLELARRDYALLAFSNANVDG